MFSSACLLASIAILFCVLKFRVHVHVTYTPSSSPAQRVKRSGRKAEASDREKSGEMSSCQKSTAMTRPVQHPHSVVWGDQETTPILDLQSALVNLGAKPQRAKAAAEHVVRNWPDAGFDVQFRAALKEVAA